MHNLSLYLHDKRLHWLTSENPRCYHLYLLSCESMLSTS